MGTAIDFEKLLSEIVFINLPGPSEPTPYMTGGDLLHGFLADLYNSENPEVKNFVAALCLKWNIHYRKQT